jgi:hypothetical protein
MPQHDQPTLFEWAAQRSDGLHLLHLLHLRAWRRQLWSPGRYFAAERDAIARAAAREAGTMPPARIIAFAAPLASVRDAAANDGRAA